MENEIKILAVHKIKTKYKVTTEEDEYLLDEDVVIKYLIFKDKIFSKEEFKKILIEQTKSAAFTKVLQYLKYGPRSEWEISNYLQDQSTWPHVRKRLVELNYLDDARYAQTMLDYYQRNNKGPRFIQQKLLEKKVNISLIDEVLLTYSKESQLEIIENIILKEKNFLSTKQKKKKKQLLTTKLLHAGFLLQDINTVINNTSFIDDSQKELEKTYQKLLNKFSNYNINENEKNKRIMQTLLSKGYNYARIEKIIKIKEDINEI